MQICILKQRAFTRLFVLFVALVSLLACSENGQNTTHENKPVKEQTNESQEKSATENRARNKPNHTEESNWPTYAGQSSGTQYSSLEQINLENIGQLEVVWTYNTGEVSTGTAEADPTSHQMTPIYANEMLYTCTPFNHIVALDPTSGKEVWRHDPGKPITNTYINTNYCRGVTYWAAETQQEREHFCGKRILEGVGGGSLVAVDANTGEVCRDFGEDGVIDLNKLDYRGEGTVDLTSPPAIYKNVVIVGSSIFDNRWENTPDGIVRGFDVRSGEEVWNWNPIPEHLSDKVGGANTWAPISIDQERGWVFLPTSSPSYDFYGENRTDPIPNGNAVVVLDALSGKKIWSYQTLRHDLWDYDLASMPTLVNVVRDEKKIPAVIQPTKMGYIFVLDRLTGEPLFPVEEMSVPQTKVPGEFTPSTQPVPILPKPVTSQSLTSGDGWGLTFYDRNECQDKISKLRNDGIYTPPSLQGSLHHPSAFGGTSWGGVAYDEESGLAVLNSSNLAGSTRLVLREQYDPQEFEKPGVRVSQLPGSPYVLVREALLSSFGAPCNPPPWGRLTAIDMNSGETVWQIPFGRKEFGWLFKTPPSWGSPNQGGPIITKGGLIFIGASLDSVFRAYNLTTGNEVWSREIPAPATATPMTFMHGREKRQYVVVAAGGHALLRTKLSDAIVAFALKN